MNVNERPEHESTFGDRPDHYIFAAKFREIVWGRDGLGASTTGPFSFGASEELYMNGVKSDGPE